jgi:thioredoxin-related protein/Flp pilus assembly protein TadD
MQNIHRTIKTIKLHLVHSLRKWYLDGEIFHHLEVAMKTLFALILATLIVTSAHAEIEFLRGDLAGAIKKAEAEKKPVMIDFITDWCRWCDTLDARTYSDAKVAEFVNGHLVAIKIDAEKGEGIAIAKKYGVSAYPTIVFIRSNGDEIDRVLGYVQAVPFLNTVTDYVNGVNTISTMKIEVKSRPNDPALRYALATKFMERNSSSDAVEHFKRLIELDSNNTLGHNEEAEYSVAVATFKESKNPAQLESFTTKYPKSQMIRNALSTLWRSYTKTKDGELARKYFTQYIDRNPDDAAMMNNYAWGCAENGINLDHAVLMAKKAVDLAVKDGDKAGYLDTYATVEFTRGNTDEAVALEQQALDILKNVPGAKLGEYEKAMTKFKSGKKTAGTQKLHK